MKSLLRRVRRRLARTRLGTVELVAIHRTLTSITAVVEAPSSRTLAAELVVSDRRVRLPVERRGAFLTISIEPEHLLDRRLPTSRSVPGALHIVGRHRTWRAGRDRLPRPAVTMPHSVVSSGSRLVSVRVAADRTRAAVVHFTAWPA